MKIRSFISGCAGLALSDAERKIFAKFNPWGLILFKRNIETASQVRELVDAFRHAVDRSDAPVFIDQEGGRVQRIGPPIWRKYPDARAFGQLYNINPGLALRTTRNVGRLMAEDLFELGITASCLPVLDVPVSGAHDVIGNRAYDNRPDRIISLAHAHVAGLMEGGVLPVMKHVPGHGRSMVDSHHELPTVSASRRDLEAVDFVPFTGMADCPMAMTAHVCYDSIDPENPATLSRKIIRNVIRRVIGFNGLLMTDDLSMKALPGTLTEKVTKAYEAGCDVVLHCNGLIDEIEEVAKSSVELGAKSARRAKSALKMRRKPQDFDRKQAEGDWQAIMGESVQAP